MQVHQRGCPRVPHCKRQVAWINAGGGPGPLNHFWSLTNDDEGARLSARRGWRLKDKPPGGTEMSTQAEGLSYSARKKGN
jgi:hypothetical protein